MKQDKLAMDGGSRIRTAPLGYQSVGLNIIDADEETLVKEVLHNKTLFRHYGPTPPHMVDDFELEAAEFIGKKYTLALSTGSAAFFCAAAALRWGPGDEIIIPAYGWITDYSCVVHTGAVPVFAPIDESLNMSPEAFEKLITPRTKAVMVIHYQGAVSRIDEICSIARRQGIQVVEDSAQTWLGNKDRKRASGDVVCFSLQANKTITSGDGGLLATDDQEIFERAVRYHDLGMIRDRFIKRLEKPITTAVFNGMQWRMSELVGAVALAQLRKLPGLLESVKEKWNYLRKEISSAIPELQFRKTDPALDTGLLLAFNLGKAENVAFFSRAIEAEGLVYGPTSYCQTMDRIDVVQYLLKESGNYFPEIFESTEEMDRRFAKIAILPNYTKGDMEDIAAGTTKVLLAMKDRKML